MANNNNDTLNNMQSGSDQEGASAVLDQAADTARGFLDQAKSTASNAYEAVTDKAASAIEDKKSTLTEGLHGIADTVRKVSGSLGEADDQTGVADYAQRYTDTAAQRIEDVAGYFETKDMRAMARDLESYARRNPAVFLGAAFALGIVAARFLKSSPQPELRTGFDTGLDHQLTTGGSNQEGQTFGATTGAM